jgi:hypothetical protein
MMNLKFHQAGLKEQNIVLRNAQMFTDMIQRELIKLRKNVYVVERYSMIIHAMPKEENFAPIIASIKTMKNVVEAGVIRIFTIGHYGENFVRKSLSVMDIIVRNVVITLKDIYRFIILIFGVLVEMMRLVTLSLYAILVIKRFIGQCRYI